MEAADPEARDRKRQRLEAAEREKLEDLQGRTLGRLKLLNRDVPLNMQKVPYSKLEEFYENLLP
eukprot:8392364-Karenia_brevis.AAC.1